MDREVKGKVVVVSGAAVGLGQAMATSFLEQGVKLAILLDMNEQKGNETAANLKQKFGKDRVVFYKCNVATDLDDIYQIILNNHKTVDIVVNNAGILDEKSIKRTMDINAIAVMEWTMKFYEYMRLDKGGRGGTIINVSSIFGYRITNFIPLYHASKYAVLGFSKSIGHERNCKKSGVRVVALLPGLTHTHMADYPTAWEDDIVEELIAEIKEYDWQDAPAIGNGTVEVFKRADTGTAWLVEGGRPAEQIDV